MAKNNVDSGFGYDIPPKISDVIDYFGSKNLNDAEAKLFFDHYSRFNWADAKGKQIANWKKEANDWIWTRKIFQEFIGKCLNNKKHSRRR